MGKDDNPVVTTGEVVDEVELRIGPQFLNLFSEHMYSSPNKAFEELVSNSWDAGADVVYIRIPENLVDESAPVWVLDNGISMDVDGFRALWSVATSSKVDVDPKTNRPQIGKFGIGKLATYLLAHELTYVCKAEDGVIRAITMDYRRIEAGPQGKLHIDPVPLEVRELTEKDVADLLGSVASGDEIAKLISEGVPRPAHDYEDEFLAPESDVIVPTGTWTLALLTSLKTAGRAMQSGRIRWILRTALPLGDSLTMVFNGVVLSSSKVSKPVDDEWTIGPGLGISEVTIDDESFSVTEEDEPYPHVSIEGVGTVTGRVRLFAEPVSGGKSEAVGASNGFFVNILGRVVNWDDPYFGLENLNHSAWAKFRATVRADGLNGLLSVNREGLQETQELRRFRLFLLALFNKARSAHNVAAKASWPGAGQVLTETWGTVPLAPLRRVVEEALEDSTSAPRFVNLSGVEDPSSTLEQWKSSATEAPGEFVSDVVLEELGIEAPFVEYDIATRRVIVNKSHPFAREHGETHEQQLLLRDAALVSILSDAYLMGAGVSAGVVSETSEYRDDTLRLVARVRRRTGAQIAELLLEATDHIKGFEAVVGDALEYLDFDVTRKGESGEPEGIAVAAIAAGENDVAQTYSFTYDTKSSKTGKTKTGNVGTGGLERHRKKYQADYILIIAPDYQEGGLVEECQPTKETPGMTPIRARDLAELLMAAAAFGAIGLKRFQTLFECHSPDEVSAWVSELVDEMKAMKRVSLDDLFAAVDEVGYEGPDAPTVSVLARAIRERKDSDFPGQRDGEIVKSCGTELDHAASFSS